MIEVVRVQRVLIGRRTALLARAGPHCGLPPTLGDGAYELEDRVLKIRRRALEQARGLDRDGAKLRHTADELTCRYTETDRERQNGAQRRIATTVLDGPDIVRGETGPFRQLLEREPERDTAPTHFPSEDAWQGKAISSHSGSRHEPLMVLIFNTMIY